MAKLNELATNALCELTVVAGGDTASAEDQAQALAALLRLVASLPEIGGGRQMVDAEADKSCQPVEDTRVIVTASGVTVTPPANPRLGARFGVVPLDVTATVGAGQRFIEGARADLSVTSPTTWAYNPDQANWVKVTGLIGTDESPWPAWMDHWISVLTARDAASSLSVPVPQILGPAIAAAEASLRAAFSRPARTNWAAAVPASAAGAARTSGRFL